MVPRLRALALLLAHLAAACGGSGSPPAPGLGEPAARADVAMNKEAYPVFPDADAGADPAVPAEQGGRGFTGDGWETSTDYDLIGDPRAVKGGVFREWELDFPGTMRIYGPETYAFNHGVMRLVYERSRRTGRSRPIGRPTASASIPMRDLPTANP
jgi:hypothetical protein